MLVHPQILHDSDYSLPFGPSFPELEASFEDFVHDLMINLIELYFR